MIRYAIGNMQIVLHLKKKKTKNIKIKENQVNCKIESKTKKERN